MPTKFSPDPSALRAYLEDCVVFHELVLTEHRLAGEQLTSCGCPNMGSIDRYVAREEKEILRLRVTLGSLVW